MCLYPKLMNNKKYTINKKNGGVIPPIPTKSGEIDKRVLQVPIPCGKCKECMKKRSRDWTIRLTEELKTDQIAQFVTLTFNTEALEDLSQEITADGYSMDNAIATIAIRRFLERWRKKYKKSVKHWLVTELGAGRYEHLHIHGIIWTSEKEEIKNIWKYGYVFIGEYVSDKTITYITKYITKIDIQHKEYKPKILCSPGLGKSYLNRYDAEKNSYNEEKTNENYTTKMGNKTQLPTYYRNKIYTEEEKEKLWIKKLNENVRYVNGIKINMNTESEKYYKILETAQKQNEKLGYGSDKIDWNQKKYENDRRNAIKQARLNEKKTLR